MESLISRPALIGKKIKIGLKSKAVYGQFWQIWCKIYNNGIFNDRLK